MEEKEKNEKQTDDCPLCHISEDTLKILKEKAAEKGREDENKNLKKS